MKRISFFCVVILVGLFLLLSSLDRNGEYVAEREFWKANRSYSTLSKDLKSVPDAAFEDLIQKYRRFIERFPTSAFIPLSHIMIARVYILRKDYPKARKQLEETISRYSNNAKIGVEAASQILRTYTAENDLMNMMGTYQRILRDYPLTELGLRYPFLIAKHYDERNDQAKAQKAFRDAIAYYTTMINQYRDSEVELYAMKMLATCYMMGKQWEEAVNTFGKLLMKFPSNPSFNSQRADSIIKSINTISLTQIKNYDVPISIYQKFIEQNSDHPFSHALNEMVRSLRDLKQQANQSEDKR